MAATAIKVSLNDIQPFKFKTPEELGHFKLMLYRLERLEFEDALPTAGKHDEESVNACAERTLYDPQKYIVIVFNHEGKATAIYSYGEKIA